LRPARFTRTPGAAEERLYYCQVISMTTRLSSAERTFEQSRRGTNTQGNHFFYLATAPDYFAPVVEKLGSSGWLMRRKHCGGS